jgi:hypothetical protein
MDDRKAASPDQNDENAETPRRQSFAEGLAGLVRDEIYDHVVSTASGGWLSYDGDDEEEPRKAPPKDGFNDRLERALAEMRAQEQAAPVAPPVAPPSAPPIAPVTVQSTAAQAAPPPLPQAFSSPRPMASNLPPAVRGFGRKQV